MEHKINDIVLYGSHGVCRITDITERKIGAETLEYYILNPIYDEKSTIFVPAQNQLLLGKMQQIPSKDEIMSALDIAVNEDPEWITNDSDRNVNYREVIDSGVLTDVIGMVKALYIHREKQASCGKKLHVSDERFLKEAEKIVFDEMALVLGIDRKSARQFLEDKLGI